MRAARTRLQLRVAPGGRRNEIVGRHAGGWKVRVKEAPEAGKANNAVLRLLADTLAVPRARLTIVSGHGTRDKVIELEGLDASEAARRLGGNGKRT
jgi:uncharacterized protein YggU (UPF0235/DUF167 family)